MVHSTCWSHVVHIHGEEIRSIFKTANSSVASMKAALTKAPQRRAELLDEFERHGFTRKLPPTPVITRWGTWLEAVQFHFQHLDAEFAWIEAIENESEAVAKLKVLQDYKDLRKQLQKVSDICPTITTAIQTLQKNGLPASDVWLTLKTVQGVLEEVSDFAPGKLDLYMSKKHPARAFWNEVQYSDPRKASQFVGSTETVPKSLSLVCNGHIPQAKLLKYKNIRAAVTFDSFFCPFRFSKTYAWEMLSLSSAALKGLSFPSSSAQVKRSFSSLTRILTPLRTSLTEENLAFLATYN